MLTGNGNERYTKVRGYDYIINATWAANHESNPTWLPAYLLYMKRAIVCRFGGMCHVDVLGLSRGHSALMYCCDKTSNNSYMQLATEFNYWMAAAGCVWQQSDQGIVANIWEGLREMATARDGSPMFRFICLSRLDAIVPWEGEIQRNPDRVRHQSHALQIQEDNVATTHLIISNMDSHDQVISRGISAASLWKTEGRIVPNEPDFYVSHALSQALHDNYSAPQARLNRYSNSRFGGTADATGAFGAVADAEEPAKVEDPLVSDGESGAEEAPCCLAAPGQT